MVNIVLRLEPSGVVTTFHLQSPLQPCMLSTAASAVNEKVVDKNVELIIIITNITDTSLFIIILSFTKNSFIFYILISEHILLLSTTSTLVFVFCV